MDDRLIVALDVGNAVTGLALAERIGDAASFYKIGLGMLTGGGLALARELKDEHGKRIFLDMKLFDIGATVEAAVRGLASFDLDFLASDTVGFTKQQTLRRQYMGIYADVYQLVFYWCSNI